MITVKEIKTKTEFCDLQKDWNTLIEISSNNNLFLTFDWLYIWWEYFGKGKDLMILTVFEESNMIGIAPFFINKLKRYKIFNEKHIQFIGEGVSDYAGIITKKGKENEVFQLILNYAADTMEYKNIQLKEISENDAMVQYFRANAGNNSLNQKVDILGSCPYIDISSSWEEYYSKIKDGIKKEIKWLSNKLEKKYKYEFIINRNQVDGITQKKLFDLNKSRLKEKGKKGWYETDSYYIFIKQALNSKHITPSISIFKLNDEIAAYVIGFIYNNKLYYWNTSINNKYKEFSPGKLLLYNLIKEMFKTRFVEEIDLLRGEEPYKYIWATGERKNIQINLYK